MEPDLMIGHPKKTGVEQESMGRFLPNIRMLLSMM